MQSASNAVESAIESLEEKVENTIEETGGGNGCCRDNKTCLWMSVVVGGCLLVAELILVVVILASPKAMGISAEDALSKGQRGFLGSFTLVMLIEGIVIATCDWCKYFISVICSPAICCCLLPSMHFMVFLSLSFQIEKDLIPRRKKREKR